MMSIGAWAGLISLIRSPFYWAKTEHGVSLSRDGSIRRQRGITGRLSAVAYEDVLEWMWPIRAVAGTARGPVPAQQGAGNPSSGAWPGSPLAPGATDRRVIIAVLAATLSISFYVWYDRHGLTLAFNDARIREMIARRVLASRTPGLAQFGTTWLPLSFMIMLPLMWNDTLFRDGLAGSLPSMAAFVMAAVYMYRLARQVTSSRTAGWVAAGVLVTNGSLLYIQATAMSETASLCALVVTVYYALRVAETHHALDIVKCAAAAVAGTLIRYENWAFAIVLVPLFAYIGWRRGRGYVHAESWVLLYGLLGFAGCAAWVLYNGVIFHDPLLSFFYGNSSNTLATQTPAQHHPLYVAKLYGITAGETLGWIIRGAGRGRAGALYLGAAVEERTLPAYVLLVPLAFYLLVLYLGINTEDIPQMGGGYIQRPLRPADDPGRRPVRGVPGGAGTCARAAPADLWCGRGHRRVSCYRLGPDATRGP